MKTIDINEDIIKVLLVEAQQISQTTGQIDLESESDIEIVAVANNGVSALEKIEALRPDLVMIDLELPDVSVISLIEIIQELYPDTKILIISYRQEEKYISQAILAGAKGYVLKTTLGKNIIRAIRLINQGYFQLSLGY